MKVLVTPSGSPLVFPPLGGDKLVALDGTRHAGGKVSEVADAQLKRLCAAAIPAPPEAEEGKVGVAFVPFEDRHPLAYAEVNDLMRDFRWIAKAIGRNDAEAGTDVSLNATGRGYGLTFPPKATPELKVGDKVAVGPSISPKAFMNARGEVVSVNGTKAKIRFDAGDVSRINRATGKKYGVEGNMPKVCLEVIA